MLALMTKILGNCREHQRPIANRIARDQERQTAMPMQLRYRNRNSAAFRDTAWGPFLSCIEVCVLAPTRVGIRNDSAIRAFPAHRWHLARC